MSFDNTLIGNRIKMAREAKGLTQENLAYILDVSSAYVSKIERGKTTLNLSTLSKICDFLELSPSYILAGASVLAKDYLHNEIIEMLNECSPEKIKLIAGVIKSIVDYSENT